MMRTPIAAAALLALAALSACAAGPQASHADPLTDRQACGMANFAGLIGKQESEIPRDQLPARTRIIHENEPVTSDYSPQRLNILLDGAGKVVSMGCY